MTDQCFQFNQYVKQLQNEEFNPFPNQKMEELYDRVIYVDMDGVIVDFNNGFKRLPNSEGLTAEQYDTKHGDDSIWQVIESYGKSRFFSELPWTRHGIELWQYVVNNFITVKILTALGKSDSEDKETSIGKRMWLRRNIPSLHDSEILMVPNKHAKKHHARPGDILIDDTEVCIQGWVRKGGIGILHRDVAQTIHQLKKYI